MRARVLAVALGLRTCVSARVRGTTLVVCVSLCEQPELALTGPPCVRPYARTSHAAPRVIRVQPCGMGAVVPTSPRWGLRLREVELLSEVYTGWVGREGRNEIFGLSLPAESGSPVLLAWGGGGS